MKNRILSLLGVVFLMNLLLPGCTSKFDDINVDPNASKEAPGTNVLAYSIRYYLNNMYDAWNDMNEPETYGGHLAKIQYIDEARYVFRTTVVENKWNYIYLTVQNLRNMQAVAEKDDNTNLKAVGMILEAFMMQECTDTWRDVPYSNAFKLSEGVLTPKYDTQEQIYPALITLLQNASELLRANKGDLGSGDILFKGNISLWKKFCNSLIVRMSMRISKVSPALAQSAFEKILNDQANYPIMLSNNDNAFFIWDSQSPYQEPWYVDALSRNDHCVSDVLIDGLKSLGDPRLSAYALMNEDGEYKGYTIGAAAQPNLAKVSLIGDRFRNVEAGFTPLMRSSELWFYIAEAANLGWNTGGVSQQTAYEKAVTLSLKENGVTDEDVAKYLALGGKYDGTLAQNYLQQWICLFKQGMEAWSLYRRTGVPALYVAPGSKYTGHNVPPFRYPYPTSETNLNKDNSSASVGKVKDDFWGQQMWWDTRTGVQ